MEETAKVVELVGDLARVRITRSSACEGCRACGAGGEGDTMSAEVHNTLNAVVGDTVELSIGEGALLWYATLAYGIPSAGLLLGFFLARKIEFIVNLVGSADMASVAGAAFMLVATVLALHLVAVLRRSRASRSTGVEKGIQDRERSGPSDLIRMVRIVSHANESENACNPGERVLE
ncbi:MAG: SoxR reducing system RseC family protein [Planctomycetota bacterium]|nr:SoxR reducing system RseC family protein [Planctomycetota bacterium]